MSSYTTEVVPFYDSQRAVGLIIGYSLATRADLTHED